ncbi:DNA helicase [Gracilaria domingensis]|nr:DNA helicase [Gracilaria domingensis]
MDDEQKRALFRQVCAARAAPPSPLNSASLTSSDSHRSAPPSPPPPPAQPRASAPPPRPPSPYASSDADTVEPEPVELRPVPSERLSSPPPRAPDGRPRSAVLSPVSSALRSRPSTALTLPAAEPSASSSADTVPPPSPRALQRVYAVDDSLASATLPRVAVVDERGIDGWEADRADEIESRRVRPRCLGEGYPKLNAPKFDSVVTQDVRLSNRGGTSSSFGVLPACVCRFLSAFQLDGVTFLYRLFERQRGGLLADAMGLGKTVQTVCFLGAAFAIWDRQQRVQQNAEQAPRILVVAPVSVKENWKREFETWTPFNVMLYEKLSQPRISRALKNGDVDVLIAGDNPVAVYGNTFFSSPCNDGSHWKWDIVIVDEIHMAKNDNTKIYKSLMQLPKNVMFGLTGTAVQNRLKELWNVMSLVVPSSLWLSYRSFRKHFIDIINRGTKKDASPYMRKRANERITELRTLLAKHMVRRPKSVIEDELPSKTDYCVFMRMERSGLQAHMYRRFQNSYDVKLLRDANLPCDCGSRIVSKDCCHRYPVKEEHLENAPIWKMHHKKSECKRCPNCLNFYLQHISRAIATHAMLVLPEEGEQDLEKKAARTELFRYYVGDFSNVLGRPLATLEREAHVSCKLNIALQLLKSYETKGHKTIIFYESLRLGDILQRWATNNRLHFEVIDGSVRNGHRQIAVDRFNASTYRSIFFISKKAGGTGLNISGADRVLIFEPCWNPTLDLQAGDRAHRLGQRRNVDIVRLVVENTIEHYVWNTSVSKTQVSNAILDNTKEEWLIRESEVGSMEAMLQMGENERFICTDSQADDFRVEKAQEIVGKNEEKSVALETKTRQKVSQDHTGVGQEEESQDVDVLGESVVCSLDVDLDRGLNDEDSDESDNIDSDGDEGQGEVYKGMGISESQFDTDVVLQQGGASNKFVVSSTNLRKRNSQVMGRSRGRGDSGINPEGPVGVNFDDTRSKYITDLDHGCSDGDSESDVPIKRKRTARNSRVQQVVATEKASLTRESRTTNPQTTGRSKPQTSKSLVASKKNKKKSEAAAVSKFAARARIRR